MTWTDTLNMNVMAWEHLAHSQHKHCAQHLMLKNQKKICFLALFCLASYFCEQCSIGARPRSFCLCLIQLQKQGIGLIVLKLRCNEEHINISVTAQSLIYMMTVFLNAGNDFLTMIWRALPMLLILTKPLLSYSQWTEGDFVPNLRYINLKFDFNYI